MEKKFFGIKSQVWVETAIYTLIGLTIITIIMSIALPQIEKMKEKAIITAAISGGIHTPGMSQYLPITPKEIADEAVRAYEAGAAVCHIHARSP